MLEPRDIVKDATYTLESWLAQSVEYGPDDVVRMVSGKMEWRVTEDQVIRIGDTIADMDNDGILPNPRAVVIATYAAILSS